MTFKVSFGRRDHDFRTPRPDFMQNELVKIDFRSFFDKNVKFRKFWYKNLFFIVFGTKSR